MPQVLSPTREATTRGSLCPTPGAWLPLAATRESPCGGEDPAQPKIKKEKKTTLKPYTGVYARRHTHTHTHTHTPPERKVKCQNANNAESTSGWKIPRIFFYF